MYGTFWRSIKAITPSIALTVATVAVIVVGTLGAGHRRGAGEPIPGADIRIEAAAGGGARGQHGLYPRLRTDRHRAGRHHGGERRSLRVRSGHRHLGVEQPHPAPSWPCSPPATRRPRSGNSGRPWTPRRSPTPPRVTSSFRGRQLGDPGPPASTAGGPTSRSRRSSATSSSQMRTAVEIGTAHGAHFDFTTMPALAAGASAPRESPFPEDAPTRRLDLQPADQQGGGTSSPARSA